MKSIFAWDDRKNADNLNPYESNYQGENSLDTEINKMSGTNKVILIEPLKSCLRDE